MNLNNFSLRWLTTLNALAVVLGFLMFYLTFKYFWSHDCEVAQVLQLQQAELQRVETLLSLERKAMGASLADYAAWDEMADFIAKPTLEFTQSNIGEHAFSSQFLDGVFIYDPRAIWFGARNMTQQRGRALAMSTYCRIFHVFYSRRHV